MTKNCMKAIYITQKRKKKVTTLKRKFFFERKKQIVYFFLDTIFFERNMVFHIKNHGNWEHTNLVGLCLGETNFYFKFMKISL
jgi:hypothetical protein